MEDEASESKAWGPRDGPYNNDDDESEAAKDRKKIRMKTVFDAVAGMSDSASIPQASRRPTITD